MSVEPDKALIHAELEKAGLSSVVVHTFDTLPSTSVWLRDLASKADEPLNVPHLCSTDWQSAGVGRRGRSWQTKPGNITFSILSTTQKPPKELLGLSLVTGLGVASCLAAELDVQAALKWPNDVLLNDLKLGGLLTEVTSVSGTDQAKHHGRSAAANTQIVTGIGINLRHDDEVVDLGIGATSLESVSVPNGPQQRDILIGKLAASVLTSHQEFFERGWAPFAEAWKARDWLYGKQVTIHQDKTTEHALACGVNEQGALLVERAGETHLLYSGNVSIRPTV
ncbi:MAG: biotin--[acetyl-CoA-carboxylase] ligase [Granulosicoccus sp.]